jgi:hypothetical protein
MFEMPFNRDAAETYSVSAIAPVQRAASTAVLSVNFPLEREPAPNAQLAVDFDSIKRLQRLLAEANESNRPEFVVTTGPVGREVW